MLNPELPLGDYRVVREVGRGGMGVVYEAVQTSLGRRVALKVLPFAAALDPRQLLRFKNETQAAAQLHHTNIVPVLGVGCERGVHFYAMQFIEGQTLAALIRELRGQAGKAERGAGSEGRGGRIEDREGGTARERWERHGGRPDPRGETRPGESRLSNLDPRVFFQTLAHLGIQAAEALDYAHRQKVIHRDVKPANLLLDVQGNVWVTDFGLARWQTDAGLTMTGDVMGTLRYMSPEQALGQRGQIDGRTDVYSLGATLYELLTLEPAFSGNDREELLHRIATEEPCPPRRLNKAIPVELETIVLKALAKSPSERYATARELAADLRRFLEHKPIQARRPSWWQRVKKWARRHRPLVVAAAVFTGLFLVLAVAALAVTTVVISREKQQTEQALGAAQQAQEEMERMLYYHRIALAERGRADTQGWPSTTLEMPAASSRRPV